jgi:hypothetical protein
MTCKGYIKNGKNDGYDLKELVITAKEMRFLFKYTNYEKNMDNAFCDRSWLGCHEEFDIDNIRSNAKNDAIHEYYSKGNDMMIVPDRLLQFVPKKIRQKIRQNIKKIILDVNVKL